MIDGLVDARSDGRRILFAVRVGRGWKDASVASGSIVCRTSTSSEWRVIAPAGVTGGPDHG